MKPMLAFLIALAATAVAQSADTWEKKKQCADQADKVMASKPQPPDSPGHQSGWRNHYSPARDQCFLEIWTAHTEGKRILETTTELLDAFERETIAYMVIGESPESWKCSVASKPVDCATAGALVALSMTT